MLNILCFTGVFEPSPLMHEFIHPQYYHSVRMGVLWKSVFVHKGTKKCNNCTTQYPNVPIPITMTWGCWFEEHQNQMANSNSIRPEDHLRSCNFDVSEALCNINLLLLLFHWSATMFECFDQGIFTTIHSVPLSSVHSNFWGPGLHILQLLDCFLDPPWNLGRFPAIFRDNPTIYFHLKGWLCLLQLLVDECSKVLLYLLEPQNFKRSSKPNASFKQGKSLVVGIDILTRRTIE